MRRSLLLLAASVYLTGSLGLITSLNSPGGSDDPGVATPEELDALRGVASEMHARWQGLDASCDPDVIFSLLYLVTTAKVGDEVAAGHFDDNGFLIAWDADFAGRYFDAYDAYHGGDGGDGDGDLPEAWRMAFEYADGGTSSATEDLLLGMNAHVNYDLAHSAYAMGLPGMANGKAEFDRVNDAFWNVVVPVGDELGARYDPGQARDGEGELGATDYGTVELLISWRENAWQNAVLLARAEGDPLATALVEAKIAAESVAVAEGLVQGTADTSAERQAYCQASGHPALSGELGGVGYGDHWDLGDATDATEYLVCHAPSRKDAGKAMTVGEDALDGHLNHGDRFGAC